MEEVTVIEESKKRVDPSIQTSKEEVVTYDQLHWQFKEIAKQQKALEKTKILIERQMEKMEVEEAGLFNFEMAQRTETVN